MRRDTRRLPTLTRDAIALFTARLGGQAAWLPYAERGHISRDIGSLRERRRTAARRTAPPPHAMLRYEDCRLKMFDYAA